METINNAPRREARHYHVRAVKSRSRTTCEWQTARASHGASLQFDMAFALLGSSRGASGRLMTLALGNFRRPLCIVPSKENAIDWPDRVLLPRAMSKRARAFEITRKQAPAIGWKTKPPKAQNESIKCASRSLTSGGNPPASAYCRCCTLRTP